MRGEVGWRQPDGFDGVEADADAGAVQADLADYAGFGYHLDCGEGRLRDGEDEKVGLLGSLPL